MFRILRDLADNECPGGKLPIHVRLWADEFYAGPKPADSEMLLGEIRSRNISMVPILQDISQLKTLFPQDKWEIFSSNCSAVAYLGSGPTAYSTHKWMSDMLGETTIDTRSETISSGNLFRKERVRQSSEFQGRHETHDTGTGKGDAEPGLYPSDRRDETGI